MGNHSYRTLGVASRLGPPKSCGYLNMRKKYRCPMRMPISSMTPPPAMIMLKAKRTHGRYMALNWVPNQKLTITSLFS